MRPVMSASAERPPGELRIAIRDHVALARPGHWFKNILVLPGAALAALGTGTWESAYLTKLGVALVAICLVSSSSYVLNEWLDARFDAFHPDKRNRPSATGRVTAGLVYLEYAVLAVAGFLVGKTVNVEVLLVLVWLWVMGLLYNVPPIRTKDRAVLDVLSEAINNPIRLLLGWVAVTPRAIPPTSLVIGYWMTGAFLMTVKRYSELRRLGSKELAAQYRLSFRYYTESSLLIAIMFYACCASFLLGIILIKYRIELLITLPFLAFGFAWYLKIGMLPDSPAQHPELLYKEWRFVLFLVFVAALVAAAFLVDLPWLDWTLQPSVRGN
jgi:4-hydroxybenzoate polyprenyltransferase